MITGRRRLGLLSRILGVLQRQLSHPLALSLEPPPLLLRRQHRQRRRPLQLLHLPLPCHLGLARRLQRLLLASLRVALCVRHALYRGLGLGGLALPLRLLPPYLSSLLPLRLRLRLRRLPLRLGLGLGELAILQPVPLLDRGGLQLEGVLLRDRLGHSVAHALRQLHCRRQRRLPHAEPRAGERAVHGRADRICRAPRQRKPLGRRRDHGGGGGGDCSGCRAGCPPASLRLGRPRRGLERGNCGEEAHCQSAVFLEAHCWGRLEPVRI
mmetsp:Transcript_14170/g.29791  ORF Transcript_14170/g.29791 Transcript_14170/m.29791 type:complete len:268 (+) Transcript_14170:413-1216(+)